MLKTTVLQQKQDKERLLSLPYVERTKAKDAKKWLSSSLIKVILGPRRAGKSVFSLMLLKDRSFAYFNFDDESLSAEGKLNLDELLAELRLAYGETEYILFDEIQNLPNWELFVNRLHRQGYNLVLTGSNATLLSKELATALTGRHIPIEILPFNLKEFLDAKGFQLDVKNQYSPQQQSELLKLLEQYMLTGGYPEVVVKNLDVRSYFNVLFDSLLFKDVVKRHNLRFSEAIDNLGTYLINNISAPYSIRRLANVLNFKSDITLERYLRYLIDAYIVFSLSSYSVKAGQRLRSPKKMYVVDNGFVNAKAVPHSPNTGKLMENLVFTELIKRGHEPNREVFYYKTRNGREVDFVLKKGIEITELLQVCHDLSNPDVEQREVKALVEAAGELQVKKITLINWNQERVVTKAGKTICIKPLWKWLI